jgi:hypothetical protein
MTAPLHEKKGQGAMESDRRIEASWNLLRLCEAARRVRAAWEPTKRALNPRPPTHKRPPIAHSIADERRLRALGQPCNFISWPCGSPTCTAPTLLSALDTPQSSSVEIGPDGSSQISTAGGVSVVSQVEGDARPPAADRAAPAALHWRFDDLIYICGLTRLESVRGRPNNRSREDGFAC